MSPLLLKSIMAFLGFASGLLISGGVFAFIAAIGIVPRLAQRTKTEKFIPFYEDVIVVSGVFGALTMFVDFYLPIGKILVILYAFCMGVFVGCLAIALAEVLNVMPIFFRRTRLTKGLPLIICAIALGKVLGSLVYFFISGFYII